MAATLLVSEIVPDARKLFLAGRWAAPKSELTDAIVNPADESHLGNAAVGTVGDCDAAIAAARLAFDEGPWPHTDRFVRAAAVQRMIDAFMKRKERILGLMTLEIGFTRIEAEYQFGMAMTHLAKFAELAQRDPIKPLPIVISPSPAGTKTLGAAVMVREPVGVVSAITPYNAGFLLGAIKAGPAIAAGNTVVLKPSPYTPFQSFLIAEVMAELDLPPGVFNLVTGGAEVGEMLSGDPRVDMVTFTGSDVVGAKVMAQAAPTLKKVHLELGGKSALVIREDAELDIAIQAGLFGFAYQCGQGCSMTTRHIVHNKIRAEYVRGLAKATAALKIGNPAKPDTQVGPLIRETARVRTESFVAAGLEDGGTLVQGGKRPAGLGKGFYFEPTIFDNVDNRSRLAQNEVFGPIAAVIGFDTDEEAIKLANDSRYGLGGAIVSRDTGRAMEMALKIRTGMVSINRGTGGVNPNMPFGGFKRSGIGREWGEEGYNEYTEIKSVGFQAG